MISKLLVLQYTEQGMKRDTLWHEFIMFIAGLLDEQLLSYISTYFKVGNQK